MDRAQLQNKIASVKPGQKLKLQFNEDAKHGGLIYLRTFAGRLVDVTMRDLLTAEAVTRSKNWEFPENKTMTVTVLNGFDTNTFVARMYRELDGIEVLN